MSRLVVSVLFLAAGFWLSGHAVPASATEDQNAVTQPCVAHHPPPTHLQLSGVDATLIFSPQGGGEALIVQAIDAAHHSILMQAYSFTDGRIFEALGRAVQRGVDLDVILDKSDLKHYREWPSVAERLAAMHIPVWIDDTVETAHNKVLILDGTDVITGSYNFSYAADERNAENLLYLRHAPELARAYVEDWQWRRGCSRKYVP
jgi:phosphatidylserine/phosphatidylglycerophosphate/cardiolipin synthase-like enzyme